MKITREVIVRLMNLLQDLQLDDWDLCAVMCLLSDRERETPGAVEKMEAYLLSIKDNPPPHQILMADLAEIVDRPDV